MAFQYDAFLSYSHAADDRLAPAVQRGLHRLGRKWYAMRALRTFRDKTGLSATPELWPDIERALSGSRFFVLLASPEAARSKWVRREVEWWTKNRAPKTMLVALTSGEIQWTSDGAFDAHRTTSLPPELERYFETEPGHVDLRWAQHEEQLSLRHSRFREAVVDLAAPIHGVENKEDLDSEDVRQHRRFRLAAWSAGVALVLLALISVWTAWKALQNAKLAEEQRETAQKQQKIAEARLVDSYWDASRTARDEGDLLESLHWNAEALALKPDASTAQALLLDRVPLMPAVTLSAMAQHEGVTGARFTPDGSRVLTWGGDGARLWSVAAFERPVAHYPHPRIEGASVSPDGTRLVTWGGDLRVRLWDFVARKTIGEPLRHDEDVKGAAFSHDGRRVVTWSGSEAALWDATTGQSIGARLRHERRLSGVSFTADDSRVLTWGYASASLWDAATAEFLEAFPHDQWVTRATVSSKLHRLLTIDQNQRVTLWNTERPRVPRVSFEREDVFGGRFDSTGDRVLTWSLDGTAKIFDVTKNRDIVAVTHDPSAVESGVFAGVFRPDGKEFVTSSVDDLRVWDAASGELQAVLPDNSEAAYTHNGHFLLAKTGDAVQVWDARRHYKIGPAVLHPSLADWSSDRTGRHLVTAGADGTVRLWTLPAAIADGSPFRGDFASGARLGPGGKQLLTWAQHTAHLWNTGNGSRTAVLKQTMIEGGSFSPDGTRILTGGYGSAILWRSDTGASIRTLDHGPSFVGDGVHAVFSSDGRRILSWSDDPVVRVWDGVTGTPLLTVQHEKGVLGAAFDGDGGFVTWGRDRAARLWNTSNGKLIAALVHGHLPRGVAFTRDRRKILTWSEDGFARLWDAQTGKPAMSFQHASKHPQAVLLAGFSGTEDLVFTTGADDVTKLWSVATGLQARRPLQHPRGDSRAASHSGAMFDPSDRRILTWGSDGTARLWDVAGSREIVPALRHSSLRGARFDGGGARVLTWGGGRARLWDARTGKMLGNPFLERCVDTQPEDDARLLTCGESLLWRPCAGCGARPDRVKVELTAQTGTEFDPVTGAIRPVDAARWRAGAAP